MPPPLPQLPVTQTPGQQPAGNWGVPSSPPQAPQFAPTPGVGTPGPFQMPAGAGFAAPSPAPASPFGPHAPFGPAVGYDGLVKKPQPTWVEQAMRPPTAGGVESVDADGNPSWAAPGKPIWKRHLLDLPTPNPNAFNTIKDPATGKTTVPHAPHAPESVPVTVGDAAGAAAALFPLGAMARHGKTIAGALPGVAAKDPVTGVGAITQAGKSIGQLAQGNVSGALGHGVRAGVNTIVPSSVATVANQAIPLEHPEATTNRMKGDASAALLEMKPNQAVSILERLALPYTAIKNTLTNSPGGVGGMLRHSFGGLGKTVDTAVNNWDVFKHRGGRFVQDEVNNLKRQQNFNDPGLPVNQLATARQQEQTEGLDFAQRFEAAQAAGDQATAEKIQADWAQRARQLRAQYEGVDAASPTSSASVGPAGQRVRSAEILRRLNEQYKDDPAAQAVIKSQITGMLDDDGLSLRPSKDYANPNFSSAFVTKRDLDNQAPVHGVKDRIPLLKDRPTPPDVEARLAEATKTYAQAVDRLKTQTRGADVGPQTPMPTGAPPGSVPDQLPPATPQPPPAAPPPVPKPSVPPTTVPPKTGPAGLFGFTLPGGQTQPSAGPQPKQPFVGPHIDGRQPGANPWTSQLPPTEGQAGVAPPPPAADPAAAHPAPQGIPGLTDENRAAVAQNLSSQVAALGGPAAGAGVTAGLMAQAAKAPAPQGLQGYWQTLGPESKALIIAGLSVTALSALKSMFGSNDKEEGDGSFLARVLPYLGIGAAAWGAGGGNVGITEKFQLPEGKNYRALGNMAASPLGFKNPF